MNEMISLVQQKHFKELEYIYFLTQNLIRK